MPADSCCSRFHFLLRQGQARNSPCSSGTRKLWTLVGVPQRATAPELRTGSRLQGDLAAGLPSRRNGGQDLGSVEEAGSRDPLLGAQQNKAQQDSALLWSPPCLHPALTLVAQLSWCQMMLPADSSLPGAKQHGWDFPQQQDQGAKALPPYRLCSWSGFQSPGAGWGWLSTASAGSAGGSCVHGQISGGGGGIGFCHRNYRHDSSAGCCGAKCQTGEERGEPVGGQPPRGDSEASTRGVLKAVLQVPASSLGWC